MPFETEFLIQRGCRTPRLGFSSVNKMFLDRRLDRKGRGETIDFS